MMNIAFVKRGLLAVFLGLFIQAPAWATVKVAATYEWVGSLVEEIGQDKVKVSVLAQPSFDPHFVPPKPSLAVKLRNADLLVLNGGQLEIGWLPPLLTQSANRRIQVGQAGFLDLSNLVALSNPRHKVSRAEGDVHPDGNPHYVMNPDNMNLLAQGVAQQLCHIDKEHCVTYQQNLQTFEQKWNIAKADWLARLAPLRGQSVVQFHESFDDLAAWAGFNIIANIEPVPGIPPSASHLEKLLQQLESQSVAMIIQEHFRDKGASEWLAKQRQVPAVVLPTDVKADKASTDLFTWFERMVQLMTVK